MRKKRPFIINQIVKAKLSFQPGVVVGNRYRVVKIFRAKSYSGWMVSIARRDRTAEKSGIIETLDSEYFAGINGNHF